MLRIGVLIPDFAPRETGMGNAGLQMTLNTVLGDQVFHQGLGIFRQIPQLAGILRANQFLQPVLLHALASAELAAIAPRSAKADPLCLQ